MLFALVLVTVILEYIYSDYMYNQYCASTLHSPIDCPP